MGFMNNSLKHPSQGSSSNKMDILMAWKDKTFQSEQNNDLSKAGNVMKLKVQQSHGQAPNNTFMKQELIKDELPTQTYDEHYFKNPETHKFECKLCARIFDTKTNCQEHIMGQHFPEYVACPYCQKKYCQGQSL